MENVYYLTHPRIDKTAVVHAPTTEKARTTFLDWLERQGLIRRGHRSYFRRDMIAEQIEDPNVPCDIVLNYGYKDFTGRFEYEPPEVHDIPVGFEEPEVHDIPAEESGLSKALRQLGDIEPSRMVEVPEEEVEEEKPRRGMMPIQKVMLKGYLE